MSPELRRSRTPLTEDDLAALPPLSTQQRDALRTASAVWTFWNDDMLVGFATVRDRSLPARRAICSRITALHALPTLDARALRASIARAHGAHLAHTRPGFSCLWTQNVRPKTPMSPRARAAAGDAIAVLSAHLAWAGVEDAPPLRSAG